MPVDRVTGRSRGLGFVEFADAAAVAEAIERFDGYELAGRQLRVDEAQERRPTGGPSGDPSGSRGPRGPSPKPSRPKGSRRNLRGRKRSL